MSTAYYHPSGRFSPLALVLTCLACAVFLPVSWVYAWSTLNAPKVISFFVVLAFSFSLYMACAAIIEFGKVRNVLLAALLGVGLGAFAWHAHWAYLGSMVNVKNVAIWPGPLDFTSSPEHLFMLASELGSAGLLTLAKWGMEFLALAILPALLSAGAARRVFCEPTGQWVNEVRLKRRFAVIDRARLKKFVEAAEAAPGAIRSLMEAGHPDPSHFSELSLYPCDGADDTYLSVFNVVRTVCDGKVDETRSPVLDLLRIPQQAASEMMADCGLVDDDNGAPETTDTDACPLSVRPAPLPLRPAVDALQCGQYDAALALATGMCYQPDRALRTDANRVCALSCAQLQRWDEAARHFEELFALEGTVHNALQVATTCVMAGRLDDGERWIRTAIAMNRRDPEVAAMLLYTSYITALKNRGHLRQAMPYLEPVKEMYEQLHSTDPTFLTLRGMPFLISFLEQSAPVVDASMHACQACSWYKTMLPHLDQPGRSELKGWLAERGETRAPAR